MPPLARSNEVEGGDELVSEFDEVLKLCPESRTFVSRYSVGHGLKFRVEHLELMEAINLMVRDLSPKVGPFSEAAVQNAHLAQPAPLKTGSQPPTTC